MADFGFRGGWEFHILELLLKGVVSAFLSENADFWGFRLLIASGSKDILSFYHKRCL